MTCTLLSLVIYCCTVVAFSKFQLKPYTIVTKSSQLVQIAPRKRKKKLLDLSKASPVINSVSVQNYNPRCVTCFNKACFPILSPSFASSLKGGLFLLIFPSVWSNTSLRSIHVLLSVRQVVILFCRENKGFGYPHIPRRRQSGQENWWRENVLGTAQRA